MFLVVKMLLVYSIAMNIVHVQQVVNPFFGISKKENTQKE